MSWDGLMLVVAFLLFVVIVGALENGCERSAQVERERRRDGGETAVDLVFDAIERRRGGK